MPSAEGEWAGVCDGGAAAGACSGAGSGAGVPVGAGGDPPPSVTVPPPPPGDPAGAPTGEAGERTPGAAPFSADPRPGPCPREPTCDRPDALVTEASAGAIAPGARLAVTLSASPTDCSTAGSSGSGTGSSSGKPGWAKIATSARPAAAVSPSRAKPVARIRSVMPCPNRLDSRSEGICAYRRMECTSSWIGISAGDKSD